MWRTRLTGSATGRTPLLVILGATAVGKTDLAILLAQALNGEIISADSRQIYRYMDIGTAKPTAEQRAAVPHYGLDLIDPDERLSVAEFQRLTYAVIADIAGRGKLPLLVGGTGQYITAVVEGWTIPEVPPDERLRAELEADAQRHGAEALLARLYQLDPVTAERIDRRNLRRVIRALEVTLLTGRPFSEQRRKSPPDYAVRTIGLTLPREQLYAQADARLEKMMHAGFLDEVRSLLARGYSRDLPSMSALGYRELAAHLLNGLPLNEALEEIRRATRDFIRRQYTWFRGHDHGIVWHDRAQIALDSLIAELRAWQMERH